MHSTFHSELFDGIFFRALRYILIVDQIVVLLNLCYRFIGRMSRDRSKGALGTHAPSSRSNYFSFSCSFRQNFDQIIYFCPVSGVGAPLSGKSWIS